MSADLLEFLTARLDEDEGNASGIGGEDPHSRGVAGLSHRNLSPATAVGRTQTRWP